MLTLLTRVGERMSRITRSGCLALGLLGAATSARADTEGWLIAESRLPVFQQRGGKNRISLRLLTDFRVAGRTGGLQQALMRLGMIWDPADWLMLASQTTLSASSHDGAKYAQEVRQELEATLTAPLGRYFSMAHRQRLEVRWTPAWIGVRQRVLQRLNLAPPSWLVHPYVFDELFFDSREALNQNRLSAGVSLVLRRNLRIEAGYIWRLRLGTAAAGATEIPWAQDHGLRLVFLFIPTYEGEIVRDGGSE